MKVVRLSLLVLLALVGSSFAQELPHIVIMRPIYYSDGVTPTLAADLTFEAWISTRPADVIDETTIGNAVWDDPEVFTGAIGVECSAFSQGIWAPGETLIVVVHGAGSNYTQAETETFVIILNNENPQWATGNGPNGEFILPIELTSFSAEPGPGRVTLRWETASEVDNVGFNVLRATERDGVYTKINADLIPGAGTTTQPHTYTYVDEHITAGLYFYKLEAVATNGDKQYSPIVEVRPVPAVFALASGYPNPMTHSSKIAFQLPREANVSLRIYNMAGREVAVLHEGVLGAGFYTKTWNGTDSDGRTVGSGVYFVRMDAQGFNATKKLVVLR